MASPSVTPLAMAAQAKAPLVINSCVLFLVIIAVGLRILTRVRGVGLGVDDGLVVVATILGILCLGVQGFFSTIGMGYDVIPSSPHYEQLITNSNLALKLLFGFDLLYVHALSTLKTSVLCFYLRVFTSPGLRKLIYGLLGLVGAWSVAFLLALVFVCHPLSYRWDPTIPGGTCGSQAAMYATLILTNVITDLVIMLLPLYTIWSFKMRGPEKIGLMACFALGMAVVIASCVRLPAVFNNEDNSENPMGGTLSTTVFLCVFEVLLGILCTSIPTLRPLYLRYKSRALTSSRLQGHGHGSGARHLHGHDRSGRSSTSSRSSTTVPPSPPSGLNQHPPSTRSMSMRSSSRRRHGHRRVFAPASSSRTTRSSQHYHHDPRAVAATTRMGYGGGGTVSSSYTTTAANSVPAAWQLNDPLTFPPLTLQTSASRSLPPSSHGDAAPPAQNHSRNPHYNNNYKKAINTASQPSAAGGAYDNNNNTNNDGNNSVSSLSEDNDSHDSRRSDEPFSDHYYAARERHRLQQQGTDVSSMAHLFPLPPSRTGGSLLLLTPPSSSSSAGISSTTENKTSSPPSQQQKKKTKGGKEGGGGRGAAATIETSWLMTHD